MRVDIDDEIVLEVFSHPWAVWARMSRVSLRTVIGGNSRTVAGIFRAALLLADLRLPFSLFGPRLFD